MQLSSLFVIAAILLCSDALRPTSPWRKNDAHSQYAKAHSLGERYEFDPRDGWQSVNASNLEYKYESKNEERELAPDQRRDLKKLASGKLGLDELKSVDDVLKKVFKGLKGIGHARPVKVTWYTGHDLKNPSCWPNGKWSPTDASFACATTLNGWQDRPQCFSFVELCNGPKKCVFTRVVDSCAGCASGSAHIDLTRAAFRQLADLDVGVLQVHFRPATQPDHWYEDLWGPKHSHHK